MIDSNGKYPSDNATYTRYYQIGNDNEMIDGGYLNAKK